MGNAATAKKGSEVESGESRARSGYRWAGRRGAPIAPPGQSPEAAGMVQASQRPPGAAGGGPRDQLPSSSIPAPQLQLQREGPARRAGWRDRGRRVVPEIPFLSRARGTHSLEQFPKYGPDKNSIEASQPSLLLPTTTSLGATGSAVGRVGSFPSITWGPAQPYHKVRGY